jgi:hypothetical protein
MEAIVNRILAELNVNDVSQLAGKINYELKGEYSIIIARKSDLYRIKTSMRRWQIIGGYDWDVKGEKYIEVFTGVNTIKKNEISLNYKYEELVDFVKTLDDIYECSQKADFLC